MRFFPFSDLFLILPLDNPLKICYNHDMLVEAHFAISILPVKRLSESEAEERGGCRRRFADQDRSGSGQ